MKTMSFRNALVAMLSIAAAATVASAGVVVNLGGGWSAQVNDDAKVSFNVDQIGENYLAIEISKDFNLPPEGGVFPSISILFVQTAPDAQTVPNIVILDESVTNLTTRDWTDYHMQVIGGPDVWFDTVNSAGFSMSPFTNQAFSDPGNLFGGDPTKATRLDADGGIVFHNSSFFPGAGAGELVIAADVAAAGDPLTFLLVQTPTPEPAALALIGLGMVFLRRRR